MEIKLVLALAAGARVEVTADNVKSVVEQASFFQELPSACPVCDAPVQFTCRHPQGFDFYGMRCTGQPAHETTFGVHKEGGTLFYKASEPWSTWQSGARPEDERGAVAPLPVVRETERTARREARRESAAPTRADERGTPARAPAPGSREQARPQQAARGTVPR
jgi:hypothetical protein